MKILYVLNSGNYGGMEQHVLDLAGGMKKKGYDVHVWCAPGPITDEFSSLKIITKNRRIIFDFDFFYIFSLAVYLKKNKINLIHAHELKAVINSLLAAFFAGTKIRITHTHTPITEWKIPKIRKIINIFIYSLIVNALSTKEIALTESRKKIKQSEGIKNSKLAVIVCANAIGDKFTALSEDKKREYRQEIFNRYSFPNSAFVWGCIGRLSREKGQNLLLRAFSRIAKDNHYLLLAGGGPLEENLRNEVLELNLADRVVVTGRFRPEDHLKLYSALDCFVHPSLAEGFGIVLLEALALGIPVLASDLEVFREIAFDQVNYFKKGDSVDMGNKMIELAENYQKVLSKTKTISGFIKAKYSLADFVNSYDRFYRSLQQ